MTEPVVHERLGDERGAILIVAIGLLLMMSLLGFFALNQADVELSITGNYRARQQAFYAAERALEYVLANPSLLAEAAQGSIELGDEHAAWIAAGTGVGKLMNNEGCRISYVGPAPLPPQNGSDPTYFEARIYAIEAVAEGPGGATARIESQVAWVVPK